MGRILLGVCSLLVWLSVVCCGEAYLSQGNGVPLHSVQSRFSQPGLKAAGRRAGLGGLQRASRSSSRRSSTSEGLEVSLVAGADSKAALGAVGDARLRPPYALSKQQFVYVVLTSIFVTCLIVADVIGVKIFEFSLPFKVLGFRSVEHTCGMLTFPVTFLLGDIINEYYGAKATRATVYVGLAMSVFVFFIINIAQALPYLDKPFNVAPAAFNSVFGGAKIMYLASVSAFFVGQLMDIWLFGVIKRLTRGNYLWLRATGSTLISQVLDSFVVTYIAFGPGKQMAGQVGASLSEVLKIASTGYVLKFVISAVITPLLYLLRHVMHRYAGLEPLPVDSDE